MSCYFDVCEIRLAVDSDESYVVVVVFQFIYIYFGVLVVYS